MWHLVVPEPGDHDRSCGQCVAVANRMVPVLSVTGNVQAGDSALIHAGLSGGPQLPSNSPG